MHFFLDAEETEPKHVSNVVKEDRDVKIIGRNQRQKAKSEQEETEPKTLLQTDVQPMHVASGTSDNNRVIGTESSPATLSTDVSTSLSNLPKEVGQSLSSMGTESCVEGSQEFLRRDPGELRPTESVLQNADGEVTTGEIDQIGEDLDATVERSRLRNDSAMYRGKNSATKDSLWTLYIHTCS